MPRGARAVRLTAEDLTRLLVNLVKNAAEAMPAAGGRIQITVREHVAAKDGVDGLVLVVEDNGPGIAAEALEKIFESGFSTRARSAAAGPAWPAAHRGLGLAIARSIVETSGGRITASNRPGPNGGARFEIELPVRKT
jgi:signal transduction histidine kinase